MSGYDALSVHKTSLPPGRSPLSRALYAVAQPLGMRYCLLLTYLLDGSAREETTTP